LFRYNAPGLFPRIRKLKSIQPRTFEEDMAIQDKKFRKKFQKEEKLRLAQEAQDRELEEMKERHKASRDVRQLYNALRNCCGSRTLFSSAWVYIGFKTLFPSPSQTIPYVFPLS
jgi:hypothetical protein